MNTKRKKGLLLTAIIVQTMALIGVICLTVMQSSIKELLGAPEEVVQIETIPTGLFMQVLPLLLIYIIGLVVMKYANDGSTKTVAIVFVVLACIFQIVLPLVSNMVSVGMAQKDVDILASYNMIERGAEFCVTPCSMVAFALFSMGCGRYLGSKDI